MVCDHILIDGNPLIHSYTQQIYQYGKFEPKTNYLFGKSKNINVPKSKHVTSKNNNVTNKSLTEDEKRRRVFDMVFDRILYIMDLFKPKKTVYFALDGPAPLAKQAQQRQRRHLSSKGKREDDESFDSTCITPGTKFMFEITKYLNYRFREYVNMMGDKGDYLANLEFIFSPPTHPGEGEHKLLNFIRERHELIKDDRVIIYGPDGDLIMLAMCTDIDDIYLVREDMKNPLDFNCLDIKNIVKSLFDDIGIDVDTCGHEDAEMYKRDFVLMGLFIGNDFLPRIRMFLMLDDGVELMMKIYKKCIVDKGEFLCRYVEGRGYDVDLDNLYVFLKEMNNHEDDCLEGQLYNTNVQSNPILKNYTMEGCSQIFNNNGEMEYILNSETYRFEYYKKKFHMNVTDYEPYMKFCDSVCLEYIKTFVWVFRYYCNGTIPTFTPIFNNKEDEEDERWKNSAKSNWRYFYPYHYPPFMHDLCDFFRYMSGTVKVIDYDALTTFEVDRPSEPFLQLLCVLPPNKRRLLPEKFRRVFEILEVNGTFKGMENISVDCEGLPYSYMGIYPIPFCDIKTIEMLYEMIKQESDVRYDVNKLIDNYYSFVYNKKYPNRYESDYGTIDVCNVVKITS
jgi:5'-3' exonuclease